jgi:hypothetical protein
MFHPTHPEPLTMKTAARDGQKEQAAEEQGREHEGGRQGEPGRGHSSHLGEYHLTNMELQETQSAFQGGDTATPRADLCNLTTTTTSLVPTSSTEWVAREEGATT